MSATSTITKLRAERDELRRALLDALLALEEDGQTVAKRRSAVGYILKTYNVEASLVEEYAEREKAKATTRFSVSKAALANQSETFRPKTQGGLPSSIAKRASQGR
jgi:hypothetical protein